VRATRNAARGCRVDVWRSWRHRAGFLALHSRRWVRFRQHRRDRLDQRSLARRAGLERRVDTACGGERRTARRWRRSLYKEFARWVDEPQRRDFAKPALRESCVA
jgi:hypothetical protein